MKFVILSLLWLSNLLATYFLFSVSTYGISMVDIISIVIALYATYSIVWKGEPFIVPPFPVLLWLSGLTLAVFLSAMIPLLSSNAEMQLQWIKTTLHYIYVLILGVAIIGSNFTINDIYKAYKIHIYFSVLVSTFGIYQLFARAFDLPFAWITMSTNTNLARGMDFKEWGQLSLNYGSFFRATSIFSEPSTFAGYTAQILSLLFTTISQTSAQFVHNKLLWWLIVIVNLVGLMLAFSLTGLFLSVILIVTYLLYERKISLRGVLIFGLVLPILLIFADSIVFMYTDVSVIELFAQRVGGIYSILFGGTVQTTGGESFFGRLDTMIRGFWIWVEYPITGFGLGCVYLYDRANQITYIDSTFFTVLAETGIVGMFFFIGMYAIMFRYLFFTMRSRLQSVVLSAEAQSLIAIIPYLYIAQVAILFTTSFFVSFWIYQTFGIIVSIIIAVYSESGLPLQKIYVMDEPLQTRFYRNLKRLTNSQTHGEIL